LIKGEEGTRRTREEGEGQTQSLKRGRIGAPLEWDLFGSVRGGKGKGERQSIKGSQKNDYWDLDRKWGGQRERGEEGRKRGGGKALSGQDKIRKNQKATFQRPRTGDGLRPAPEEKLI